MLSYKIKESDFNQRADALLAQIYSQLSRSLIQKLAKEGKLFLDQQLIRASFKIKNLGVLSLDYDGHKELSLSQPELDILHEDSEIIVVNKPSGLLSHLSSFYQREASVAGWLRLYLDWPILRFDDDEKELRKGLVHRLDRGTSGLLLLAKNERALNILREQFKARQIEKIYFALVNRHRLPPAGLIDKPIARSKSDRRRFTVNSFGRQSVSLFEIQKSHPDFDLVKLSPQTGRTHQLRVHLVSMRAPIVGDQLYGGQVASRLMLHAFSLKFKHPLSQQWLSFSVPLPADFKKLISTDE